MSCEHRTQPGEDASWSALVVSYAFEVPCADAMKQPGDILRCVTEQVMAHVVNHDQSDAARLFEPIFVFRLIVASDRISIARDTENRRFEFHVRAVLHVAQSVVISNRANDPVVPEVT